MICIWIYPLKGFGYGSKRKGSLGRIFGLVDICKSEEFSNPGVPYNSFELIHEIEDELSRLVLIS